MVCDVVGVNLKARAISQSTMPVEEKEKKSSEIPLLLVRLISKRARDEHVEKEDFHEEDDGNGDKKEK